MNMACPLLPMPPVADAVKGAGILLFAGTTLFSISESLSVIVIVDIGLRSFQG